MGDNSLQHLQQTSEQKPGNMIYRYNACHLHILLWQVVPEWVFGQVQVDIVVGLLASFTHVPPFWHGLFFSQACLASSKEQKIGR